MFEPQIVEQDVTNLPRAGAKAGMLDVIECALVAHSRLGKDILLGFDKKPKQLSSKYFYDDEGSKLFSFISTLPEYYPTVREIEILNTEGVDIADRLAEMPTKIVELGAGDGTKTKIILSYLDRVGAEFTYLPVDVSSAALEELETKLLNEIPSLRIRPLISDNLLGLQQISRSRNIGERLCVLFLGSSIGNCERNEVENYLRELRALLREGDLFLIGFDLIKDPKRLMRAYSDSRGVTREFNLNLLKRMNRELGADFQIGQFDHVATWNPTISGMESWLVSLCDQTVHFAELNKSFEFNRWEHIRTEVSLKFDPKDLSPMAERCGFKSLKCYTDTDGDFVDCLWRVETGRAQ